MQDQMTHAESMGKIAELAEENEQLHHSMVVLLDILRRWEPNNSSDADRAEILQAMYLCGILERPSVDVFIAAPNLNSTTP